MLRFALFYLSRGYVIGLLFGVAFVLFGPGAVQGRVFGLFFGLFVTVAAALYHYRKQSRRDEDSPD